MEILELVLYGLFTKDLKEATIYADDVIDPMLAVDQEGNFIEPWADGVGLFEGISLRPENTQLQQKDPTTAIDPLMQEIEVNYHSSIEHAGSAHDQHPPMEESMDHSMTDLEFSNEFRHLIGEVNQSDRQPQQKKRARKKFLPKKRVSEIRQEAVGTSGTNDKKTQHGINIDKRNGKRKVTEEHDTGDLLSDDYQWVPPSKEPDITHINDLPDDGLEDIEGSDDDDIFTDKRNGIVELRAKLKDMLIKARRPVAAVRRIPSKIGIGGDSEPWYSDLEDDEDIEETVNRDNVQKRFPMCKEGTILKKYEEMYVGLRFMSAEVYKDILRDWSIRCGFDLVFEKIEKRIVTAWCAQEGCFWRIHASLIQNSTLFQVKSIHGEHTCTKVNHFNLANSNYLAKRMANVIKDNPDIEISKLQNSIKRKCELNASYWRVLRAKRRVMDEIRGDADREYSLLWDYCETVRQGNPGSTLLLKKVEDSDPPIFDRMYFSLSAMKLGFLGGCRPLIGLDGCFVKTFHGGQVLCAIGRDGNDNLLPIALALVSVENKENWSWFLEVLLEDLGGIENARWTFISDRQKGLLEALKELAPDCEHRYCLRHLYENFKGTWNDVKLKELFWKAASTANKNEFELWMKEIEKVDPKVSPDKLTAVELRKIEPQHWTRSHFSNNCKTDVLVNNLCESFNYYILEAREKAPVSMFEWIRTKLTVRIRVKREGMEKYTGVICPNILKKIKICQKAARNCYPMRCCRNELEVENFNRRYIVDLDKKTCTCGMFQLNSYPCRHACAAIAEKRASIEDFVDDYYKKQMYMKVYEHTMHGVPDEMEWIKTDYVPLKASKIVKKKGRPKKMRRKAPGETKPVSTRTGHKKTCQRCFKEGHTKKSCSEPPHPNSKLYQGPATETIPSQPSQPTATGTTSQPSQPPIPHPTPSVSTVDAYAHVKDTGSSDAGRSSGNVVASTTTAPDQSGHAKPPRKKKKNLTQEEVVKKIRERKRTWMP